MGRNRHQLQGLLLRLPATSLAVSILGPTQVARWQDGGVENGSLVPQIPETWNKLRGAIGTICVTGDDRIGKSTLLTQWVRTLVQAPHTAGFEAGHNRWTHTKGLWSAVLPTQATGLSYHLNLCDSQGVKQVSEMQQWRLFSANVLIPSVLVYMVINVVQNNEFRDLASFAHQFLELSETEFGEFGQFLSPHLIVVVREESDLGDGSTRNLSSHLEEALQTPGCQDEKALVRKVFQTREAFSLSELPKDARSALRSEAGSDGGPSAAQWRESGEAVLRRALAVLEERRLGLHQGGPELAEWYHSVLTTVNSQDERSMGRLVRHGGRVAAGQWQRRLLHRWRGPVLSFLIGAAVLFGLGGCLGRWLDRIAWVAWVAVWLFYAGASPLVTTPLAGLVPRFCDKLELLSSSLLLRTACRGTSASTAAVLTAGCLGALSYPTAHVCVVSLLSQLPLAGRLSRVKGALALALAFCAWAITQEDSISVAVARSSFGALLAGALLLLLALCSAIEVACIVRRNRLRALASERGRALHFYVAARIQEVHELEQTTEWAEHYHRHHPLDALWQSRRTSLWQPLVTGLQSLALLAWAWLIHPHCDALLVSGTTASVAQVLWRFACFVSACVAAWTDEREVEDEPGSAIEGEDDVEPDGATAAGGVEADHSDSAALVEMMRRSPVPICGPESGEELKQRLAIAQMRITSSKSQL